MANANKKKRVTNVTISRKSTATTKRRGRSRKSHTVRTKARRMNLDVVPKQTYKRKYTNTGELIKKRRVHHHKKRTPVAPLPGLYTETEIRNFAKIQNEKARSDLARSRDHQAILIRKIKVIQENAKKESAQEMQKLKATQSVSRRLAHYTKTVGRGPHRSTVATAAVSQKKKKK